jgi:hypothetical protein
VSALDALVVINKLSARFHRAQVEGERESVAVPQILPKSQAPAADSSAEAPMFASHIEQRAMAVALVASEYSDQDPAVVEEPDSKAGSAANVDQLLSDEEFLSAIL